MPDFSLEQKFPSQRVAGLDEVGCGPWAGPVVAACACFLTPTLPESLTSVLNDSKKMTPKAREKVFDLLRTLPSEIFIYGIGQASVQEIDQMNIRKASHLAMKRAFESLSPRPEVALVDGNVDPKLGIPTHLVIKGDSLSLSIAAASILAKVTRDREMTSLAKEFPHYAWEKNAGYGTKAHQEALALHGVTPHHRKSFSPIALLLTERCNEAA